MCVCSSYVAMCAASVAHMVLIRSLLFVKITELRKCSGVWKRNQAVKLRVSRPGRYEYRM